MDVNKAEQSHKSLLIAAMPMQASTHGFFHFREKPWTRSV